MDRDLEDMQIPIEITKEGILVSLSNIRSMKGREKWSFRGGFVKLPIVDICSSSMTALVDMNSSFSFLTMVIPAFLGTTFIDLNPLLSQIG